jgi:adenosyl cobinamide kinase/adenosyl cobinamide phosphate guanylyltransferase
MALILLLGGARSGKSEMAVGLASESGSHVTLIATALAGDEEMAERIERHRESRPAGWRTVEAPLDLLGAIRSVTRSDFLIVDCLTLWVSNLLGGATGVAEIDTASGAVIQELRGRNCVVVSNEVGLGIVPANALARTFRDALGSVNSLFAAAADRAVLMVAGRAVDLTSAQRMLGAR